MSFIIEGREIETDPEGFLRELSDWSESLANAIAEKESLALTEAHWEVINFLRQGYAQSGTVPNMRYCRKPSCRNTVQKRVIPSIYTRYSPTALPNKAAVSLDCRSPQVAFKTV